VAPVEGGILASAANLFGRWIRAAVALFLFAAAAPAVAESPGPCFAVTADDRPPSAGCTDAPSGYQDRWLWLRLAAPEGRGWRVVVRPSRFERLVVQFSYADGHRARQEVARGAYGDHWRIGGKLAFDPPRRHAAVSGVALGFERLASHDLLRVRTVPAQAADRTESVATLITGAALALLGFSAAYNLGVGLGSRRRNVLWHSTWAACVFGWGLLWTQVALLLLPGLAGPVAVQGGIILSSWAVACAGQFFVTSLEPESLPAWARRGLSAIAALVALAGTATALAPGASMMQVGELLSATVLAATAAIAAALAVAIRRGSRPARDFALSWALPIAAVLWTFLSDSGLTPDDHSGQLMVLGVCALQTVGLSLIVSHRLASVRRERREAEAREAKLRALADTDPLTGLLNRRGFVAGVESALAAGRGVGLILLDLDEFKSINDGFGHDVGDRVLSAVARTLLAHAGEATVGRLGGEEFGVAVAGLPAPALARLAERLRRSVAALRVEAGPSRVTASFGVSMETASFEALYRSADRALYRAKAQGRNRVTVAEASEAPLALVG
jgi:diguanylate cyclase (GGDEF)-like protein